MVITFYYFDSIFHKLFIMILNILFRLSIVRIQYMNTSLAFAGWSIEINAKFEVKRPLASAEPPSGGRPATFVPYV